MVVWCGVVVWNLVSERKTNYGMYSCVGSRRRVRRCQLSDTYIPVLYSFPSSASPRSLASRSKPTLIDRLIPRRPYRTSFQELSRTRFFTTLVGAPPTTTYRRTAQRRSRIHPWWFSSTRQDKRPGQKASPCVVLVLVLVLERGSGVTSQ